MSKAKTQTITVGEHVIRVSPEDYNRLSQYTWSVQVRKGSNKKLVITRVLQPLRTGQKKRHKKIMAMHRIITGASNGTKVIHIDDDGLNNRRDNLYIHKQWANAPYDWDMDRCSWIAYHEPKKGDRTEVGAYSEEFDAITACAFAILEREGERDPVWFPLKVLRRIRARDPEKWQGLWPSFETRPEDDQEEGEQDIL